jgi:hypothetical protein
MGFVLVVFVLAKITLFLKKTKEKRIFILKNA